MIRYEELRPGLWPAMEKLFGPNGACGGCWCMWWRVERGGRLWEETKGARAKKLIRGLVRSGRASGIIAFEDGTPTGWCSFGPRADFPRLETVKAYAREDSAGVWCVNCFYIPKTHRGRGLARGLLGAAVEAMRRRSVEIVEAYPVVETKDGKPLAAVFSWTGPLKIFAEMGFQEVQRLSQSKPLVRLHFK